MNQHARLNAAILRTPADRMCVREGADGTITELKEGADKKRQVMWRHYEQAADKCCR